MTLMIGRTLSHYRIVEALGRGGMGEVYLAEDTKLSRRVALKLLPELLAGDPDALARFEREAKALAALNHPGIVTVYSVEEDAGLHFITMELVKGKTLREMIPKKGMDLEDFFRLAVPLADAVAAAHAEGVIHRDLKPANVMVTDDGRVKVLDFGLAKSAGLHASSLGSEAPTAEVTREGGIVGTLYYMSPEQAEGKTVDHRTDVFSLGVLYYEMLTGARPFEGETPASVLGAVLKDDPPSITELKGSVPKELSRIVRRCLAKDPSRRPQAALDVRNELEEARDEMASTSPERGPSAKGGRMAVALGVAIAAAIGGYALRSRVGNERTRDVPRLSHPRQITSAEGMESYPSWSPDGSRIVYAAGASKESNWDLWVTQIPKGSAINLTQTPDVDERYPSWSPDGTQIAFYSWDESGAGCSTMPAFGGPARRIAASAPDLVGAEWSFDGQELMCIVGEPTVGPLLRITRLDSGESRDVRLPSNLPEFPYDVAWSPDERLFSLVMAGSREAPITQLWLLRADDGKATALTDGSTNVWGPSFGPDGTLYYVSNAAGTMDLWRQRIGSEDAPEGPPEALTTGVGMFGRAVVSPDGKHVAYSKGGTVAHLWRAPLLEGRRITWADAQQLTFDQAFVQYVDVSRDGKNVAFSSDRSGNVDLWLMPAGGGPARQLTFDRTPDWAPAFSPSGDEIAFYAYRGGTRDIWVMPLGVGAARQLTTLPGQEYGPRWSPDGTEIAFYAFRHGLQVLSVPASGGEPIFVVNGARPTWSPDGNWLAFDDDPGSGISLVSATGKDKRELVRRGYYPIWSRDGTRVFYLDPNLDNIWAVTVANRKAEALTDFSGRSGTLGGLALATDGRYLYFTWRQDRADLWVMDVEE